MKRNPFLFIVGAPRSGTTLLKRMIDAHSRIAVTRETHWIPRFYRKRIGLTPEGRVTPDLAEQLCSYHRFALLDIGRPQLEQMLKEAGEIHFSRFVSRLYDTYGMGRDKPLVADKTPGYVRHIGLLASLWPDALFVHLVRDGRDVTLSMLQWDKASRAAGRFSTWQSEPVATTALWWKSNLSLGLSAGRDLGPGRYLEVHYERLCRCPDQESRRICEFLQLPFDSKMLSYHEGRTRPGGEQSAKKAFLPPTPGLRDWRRQMPAGDVELFEAAAGDLLSHLGYERSFSNPGREARRRVAEVRRRFDRPLPEAT